MITNVPFLVSEDGDAETLKVKTNLHHLRMMLRRSGFGCDELDKLCIKDMTLDTDGAEKIIGWALGDYATRKPYPGPNAKINLSLDSIDMGIGLLKARLRGSAFSKKYREEMAALKEFMERLSSDVIPPNLIGVKFDDIGALQNLKELVIFPFQRPQLSCKRKLSEMQPCKSILLYGPPGTGKTMLAKAVAVEAGANFINISMSSIADNKLFGGVDKYIDAVFSLASKKSPCVIFVDNVDRMLGRRENPGEHEATLEIKKAFMKHWAGLLKSDREGVLVLAATARPFDLDEAVTGQFCRRFLAELPDAESRSQILKVILRKTTLSDDVDLVRLASMANGYSGKDLKKLCVTASNRRAMEIYYKIESELAALAEGKIPPALHGSYDIPALNMQDFIYTLEKEVCASIKSESVSMKELQQWNERYGEGGSRKRTRDGCVMQY